MKSFVFSLLNGSGAGEPGAAPQGPLGMLGPLLPFVAIIAIFYFLIIRPQNKRQKETQRMLAALKKGDKIVTIGGIHGVIQNVKESSVIVKVDEGTKLEFSRSAISSVEAAAREEKTEDKDDKKAGDSDNPPADKKQVR
jgi:preprotein translocase subunit YajC